MYRKLILLFLLLSTVFGTTETVYRTADTTQNYYIISKPDAQIERVLFLLPGMGTTPEEFMGIISLDFLLPKENTLLAVASPEGFLTHYMTDGSIEIIDEMLAEIEKKYSIPEQTPLFLGGFSIGGTGALRYAQLVQAGKTKTTLPLTGVFAVDPPLDFEREWKIYNSIIGRNRAEVAVFEANYMLDLMKKCFGGSPKEQYENYLAVSPFTASHRKGGNIAAWDKTPLRFYTEPDTTWWLQERGAPYEELNSYGIDSLEKVLNASHVEVIRTEKRGYRQDGKRHPHSWSIVDEQELILWMKSL